MNRRGDLEREILSALVTVVRQWGSSHVQGDVASKLGVDIPDGEIRMIYMLGCRTDDLTPGEIAEHLGVSRPTVSKSLTILREAGLVTHEVAPDDRRSVYVALTEQGRAAYSRLVHAGMELIRAIGEPFAEEEREVIGRFLSTLASNLGGPPPVVLPECAR